MNKYLTIGQAAEYLGVSTSTMRRWEKEGKLIPERTQGNQRRYAANSLRPHVKVLAECDRKTAVTETLYKNIVSGVLTLKRTDIEGDTYSFGGKTIHVFGTNTMYMSPSEMLSQYEIFDNHP